MFYFCLSYSQQVCVLRIRLELFHIFIAKKNPIKSSKLTMHLSGSQYFMTFRPIFFSEAPILFIPTTSLRLHF